VSAAFFSGYEKPPGWRRSQDTSRQDGGAPRIQAAKMAALPGYKPPGWRRSQDTSRQDGGAPRIQAAKMAALPGYKPPGWRRSQDTSSQDTSSQDTSSQDTSSQDTSFQDTSFQDTSFEKFTALVLGQLFLVYFSSRSLRQRLAGRSKFPFHRPQLTFEILIAKLFHHFFERFFRLSFARFISS
jgi:hypothetical protein